MQPDLQKRDGFLKRVILGGLYFYAFWRKFNLEKREVLVVGGAVIIGKILNVYLGNLFRKHEKTDSSILTADNSENDEDKFFCEICMESKSIERSFETGNCSHLYCLECILNYITAKVASNVSSINCPHFNCKVTIQPESCNSVLTTEIYDRWLAILIESVILPTQKYYCPFKDCSALLWNDGMSGGITAAECPHCHRLFCARCQVPWHGQVDCREFLRVNRWKVGKDEILMKKLAKLNQWNRCPKCSFYVEKVSGCLKITCRCKYQFCYRCGSSWTPQHYDCKR